MTTIPSDGATAAKPSTVQFSALAPTGTVSLADSFDAVFRSTISTEPTHNAEELAHTDHVVDETPEELWDEVMDTHARGTFLGMKHAVPKMRDSAGGSIINISSVLGMVGRSNRTAYVAAKGAIRLMTKAVALESAKDNIRVNSVHPGEVLTSRSPARHTGTEWCTGQTLCQSKDCVKLRIPLGRLAKAEEIANAILYLASDESSYVTGSELVVDGGLIAQ